MDACEKRAGFSHWMSPQSMDSGSVAARGWSGLWTAQTVPTDHSQSGTVAHYGG